MCRQSPRVGSGQTAPEYRLPPCRTMSARGNIYFAPVRYDKQHSAIGSADAVLIRGASPMSHAIVAVLHGPVVLSAWRFWAIRTKPSPRGPSATPCGRSSVGGSRAVCSASAAPPAPRLTSPSRLCKSAILVQGIRLTSRMSSLKNPAWFPPPDRPASLAHSLSFRARRYSPARNDKQRAEGAGSLHHRHGRIARATL